MHSVQPSDRQIFAESIVRHIEGDESPEKFQRPSNVGLKKNPDKRMYNKESGGTILNFTRELEQEEAGVVEKDQSRVLTDSTE
jgi:hypothetical protein